MLWRATSLCVGVGPPGINCDLCFYDEMMVSVLLYLPFALHMHAVWQELHGKLLQGNC